MTSTSTVLRHSKPPVERRDVLNARWVVISYWVLAAIPVAVTLFLPALVITDGGLHLESAVALNGLVDGRWTGLVNWTGTVPPNLLVEVALAVLIRIMDPEWALRLVACVLLLGFAAGARAVVKALKAPAAAGILFLPFEAHYLFQAAQLGFTAGVALALASVALVLRHPERIPPVKLGLLLTATWLTHIFPTLLAMIGVVAIVFTRSFQGASGDKYWYRLWRAATATVKQLALPIVPVVALTAAWVATAPVFVRAVDNPPHDLIHAIKNVVGMTWSTVAYSRIELPVYRVLALTLYVTAGILVAYRLRAARHGGAGVRDTDGLLVAAVAVAVIAIVMPDANSGGAGLLEVRTSLFLPLFLVAWIVANVDVLPQLSTGRWRTTAALLAPVVIAVSAVLAVTAVRLPRQEALADKVLDMRALEHCVSPGWTMAQLDLADASAYSQDSYSLVRQTGLMAADRQLLALDNESGWYPYYPWGFTDRARADHLLQTARNGAARTPPEVALASAMNAGLPLDVVVLYGRRLAAPATLADTHAVQLLRDLQSGFYQSAISKTGDWEVWLRQGLVGPCR
jgi:hypothetical protein